MPSNQVKLSFEPNKPDFSPPLSACMSSKLHFSPFTTILHFQVCIQQHMTWTLSGLLLKEFQATRMAEMSPIPGDRSQV